MSKIRRLLHLVCLSLLLCTSCGTHSLEDFREEGESVSRALAQELNHIHTREELTAAGPKLTQLFNDLVETIIAAHEYSEKHPSAETPPLSPENHSSSDQLRAELSRLYQIDGAREVIEKCQEKALNRLDAYERQTR